MTRNGSWISFVVRYLMSSYSPSGGMKEIACSVSNFVSFTHWWNWQSSIATAARLLQIEKYQFPTRFVSSKRTPCLGRHCLASSSPQLWSCRWFRTCTPAFHSSMTSWRPCQQRGPRGPVLVGSWAGWRTRWHQGRARCGGTWYPRDAIQSGPSLETWSATAPLWSANQTIPKRSVIKIWGTNEAGYTSSTMDYGLLRFYEQEMFLVKKQLYGNRMKQSGHNRTKIHRPFRFNLIYKQSITVTILKLTTGTGVSYKFSKITINSLPLVILETQYSPLYELLAAWWRSWALQDRCFAGTQSREFHQATRISEQNCSSRFPRSTSQNTTAWCRRIVSKTAIIQFTCWNGSRDFIITSKTMAALTFCRVTAQIHTLPRLTWKNEVRAMLVTGERTCWRAWMTLTLKASTAFRLKIIFLFSFQFLVCVDGFQRIGVSWGNNSHRAQKSISGRFFSVFFGRRFG